MYLRISDISSVINDGNIRFDNRNGNLYVALVKARIPFLFYNVPKDQIINVKNRNIDKPTLIKSGSYNFDELIKASGDMLWYDDRKERFNLEMIDWSKAKDLFKLLGGDDGVPNFLGDKTSFSFVLDEIDGIWNFVDYRASNELYCYNVVGKVAYGSVLDVIPEQLIYKKLKKGVFSNLSIHLVDKSGVTVISKLPIEIELSIERR